MPIGTYSWQQAHTRHLGPIDYEELVMDSSLQPLSVSKVEVCEFAEVIIQDGPIRALWYPGASSLLDGDHGVRMFNGQNMTLNRLEALYWLATLATGGVAGSLVQVTYYQ